MAWQWSPAVIAELAASAILLLLAVYFPWRDLTQRARLMGVSLVFACSIWVLSHAMEIGLPSVAYKEGLVGAQLVLGVVAITLWLFYIYHYLGPRKLLSWRIYLIFSIIPPIAILALSTNSIFGLMWTEAGFDSGHPYLPLQPNYGIIYWSCMVYVAILTLTGSYLIIWSIIRTGKSFGRQAVLLIVAAVLPLITAFIEVTGLLSYLPIPVGITPLVGCIGATILVFNLPQFHLEQVLPFARDISFERVGDCILVLDKDNRVLDLNPAAEQLTGHRISDALGLSIELIWPYRSSGTLPFNKNTAEGEELTLERDGKQRIYTVHVSTTVDSRKHITSKVVLLSDITERKKAEEELRESAAQYRLVTDNMRDQIWLMDLNLKPTYISPSVEKLRGYTFEELTQLPPEKQLTATSFQTAMEFFAVEMAKALADPTYFARPLELEWYCKDGSALWTENTFSQVLDENGKLSSLLCVGRDITERKKTEGDLQQRAALLDTAYDSIIAYDTDGKIIYANETACSLRGYNREEMLAMNMRLLVPQEEFPNLNQRHKLLAQHGELSAEAVHVKKDGSLFLVDTHLRLVELAGKLITIAVHRDITERKQMEKLLIDNEARYRSLFEHNPTAVYSIDLQGRFTSVNAAAMRLTGYSEEEALRISIADVAAPDYLDIMRSHFVDSLRGESQSYEAAINAKDGKRIDVHLTSTPIVIDGNIVGIYGIAEDISDRKRLEEEQRRVAKLESVGLLAGGIAHDFNNILGAILGNIILARTEAVPGSELHNSLEQAERASQRARRLTQQLLTFSKGGAPVTKLAPLTELLRDTAGFALHGSSVKCQFSIPSDLWHAEIDTGQVSQVIHNLVINAQQAMPDGGSMDLRAENIALSETQSLGRELPLKKGNYIRISVTDHGTGIPAENLKKIFDPFFTTKQRGSGLGLATSFSIARQHGGHLSAESKVGSGSTFYLYLPASMETATIEQDNKEVMKPAGKARILVMDDEQGIREIAGRMLSHLGYQDIDLAADGAEAIKLYKAAMKSGNPYTVVILDLTIAGGMGGKDTIRKLLKIDTNVKAIVSSGYADDSAMAEYRGYGFSGMVAKPYTLEELGKALHNVTR